ncbi:MAG: hypothetical protein DHS20C18_16550 [Saprospiraceae bacterium]|nr:MAG: hypothetical protein DHS20C18_16550 [Saprospiraceae bacterium]
MSVPLKVIIMILVWLLYSIFAYKGCLEQCCTVSGVDQGAVTTVDDVPPPPPVEVTRYPIDFQWSNAKVFTNEGFDGVKQNLLAKKTDDNILEITGHYFEAESKPDSFENMGFARAEAVKQLLLADLSSDRIRTRARLVDEGEGVRDGYFEAISFKWLEPEHTVAETLEELDDRIIIRFAMNSTEKDYDPAVEEYLTKLAERVKKSGEKISITGHTDNVGPDDFNMTLGSNRAGQIAGILRSKGVPSAQIITASKGETQPSDTNDTEEGRHNNRRAEVRLIKN